MTALEHYQPPPANGSLVHRPAPPANRTVVALTEWAEAARSAHEVSEVLVRTPFVPEAFRDNPYAATAAILAGDEVGLSPMASLNAFDVIQGRAAPKAITLRAIVQSAGHEIWLAESSESRAVVQGRRAGSSKVEESVWTIQRAQRMKLAGKSQWQLQPQAMLVARATAECCRLVASDAILGIPYASEEVADDVAAAVEAAPPPAPRTAQRAQRAPRTQARASGRPPAGSGGPAGAAAPAPASGGPPLPGEDGYDEPLAPAPAEDTGQAEPEPETGAERPATREQNRMMHALFRDADVTDRDERLQLTGLLLGRALDTSKGLTVADATRVIDELTRMQQTDGGLAAAVNDLLNEAALRESEGDDQAAAEQAAADDPAGAE